MIFSITVNQPTAIVLGLNRKNGEAELLHYMAKLPSWARGIQDENGDTFFHLQASKACEELWYWFNSPKTIQNIISRLVADGLLLRHTVNKRPHYRLPYRIACMLDVADEQVVREAKIIAKYSRFSDPFWSVNEHKKDVPRSGKVKDVPRSGKVKGGYVPRSGNEKGFTFPDLGKNKGISNKDTNNNKDTKSSSAISDENDLETAYFIFDKIRVLNPQQVTPDFHGWADVVRKMRMIDGRSDADIRSLFSWANRDSFWRTNILSPAKLRKQWDKLWIKRKHGNGRRGEPEQLVNDGGSFENFIG